LFWRLVIQVLQPRDQSLLLCRRKLIKTRLLPQSLLLLCRRKVLVRLQPVAQMLGLRLPRILR
jgi:hypothetical protein